MVTFRLYVGHDPVDDLAWRVCKRSVLKHASVDVEVIPVSGAICRKRGDYWRPYYVDEKGQKFDQFDGKPFSTDFSYARFCVPMMENYGSQWVGFCDPDMLWRADIAELLDMIEPTASVMCVHHDHRPIEAMKMHGVMQTTYRRKNWSSLMLLKPSACTRLTRYTVNRQDGGYLHSLCWVMDEEIRPIPEEWNWLEGWSPEGMNPKAVHYTRGTPDMIAETPYQDEWWGYVESGDRAF